jgi:uncharacterized protein YnzC (UPF0291/DUF896 family)
MNLQEDYAAYKATVANDAPDNYIEYARATPTQHPAQYPTIYDYIRDLADNINRAIAMDDPANYRTYLDKHKYAMKELFKKMAREMIVELGFNEVTPELLKQFKKEFGDRWSKHLTVGRIQ